MPKETENEFSIDQKVWEAVGKEMEHGVTKEQFLIFYRTCSALGIVLDMEAQKKAQEVIEDILDEEV